MKNYRLSLSLALRRNTHSIAWGNVDRPEFSPISSDISLQNLEISFTKNVHKLFDEMPDQDVLSVTTLIGRFARRHQYKEAICVFSRMFLVNIKPNEYTFATVIHSSTVIKDIYSGMQFHACAMKMGLHSSVFVGSAMLNYYAKLCSIEEARIAFDDIRNPNVVSYTTLIHGYLKKGRSVDALRLFKEMPERNVVSWNAVIGGFSQMGHNEEAVDLFVEMLREGFVPDQSTFPCLITAASNIASLGIGKSFHAWVVKSLCSSNVFIGNSLVSFYAKCGSMEDSLLVFDELPDRNIVSWNAVICGFAQNGRGEDAVIFFERMRVAARLRPNSVTLLGLLWACNHAGLVEKGYSYFNQIRVEEPGMLKPEHYACMVDLLSRFGRLNEAARFLHDLPFDPGIGFWKALLGGCHIHSNTELSDLVAQKIIALDPEDVSSYVMLSNAYSAAGKWQNVSAIRREMKEKGLKRIPGCSWMEVQSKIHVFVNSDKSHHEKDDIYSFLNFCIEQLRDTENTPFLVDY
ncbi:pentatricopeptide repeat-containing protein At5g42450, mitochondrial [Mercurialis annua]|uniref:pentatricopeptide repeat-containing protein At5g42450, mitochondrial n=1 Tax=Mercurialis annua TaxID=3986 RepID=UPI002160D118|nr:pentatricopeptide repeat-containing protein At5g42450, mitochondrial [Mercurialis annua]